MQAKEKQSSCEIEKVPVIFFKISMKNHYDQCVDVLSDNQLYRVPKAVEYIFDSILYRFFLVILRDIHDISDSYLVN